MKRLTYHNISLAQAEVLQKRWWETNPKAWAHSVSPSLSQSSCAACESLGFCGGNSPGAFPNCTAQLRAGTNQGRFLLHFIGHGTWEVQGETSPVITLVKAASLRDALADVAPHAVIATLDLL